MTLSRRTFAGLIGAGALHPATLWAQSTSGDPVLDALNSALFGTTSEFEDGMAFLEAAVVSSDNGGAWTDVKVPNSGPDTEGLLA